MGVRTEPALVSDLLRFLHYIQVFNQDYIHELMKELIQRNIRIIVVSQMTKHMEIDDIFETVSQTNSENS